MSPDLQFLDSEEASGRPYCDMTVSTSPSAVPYRYGLVG